MLAVGLKFRDYVNFSRICCQSKFRGSFLVSSQSLVKLESVSFGSSESVISSCHFHVTRIWLSFSCDLNRPFQNLESLRLRRSTNVMLYGIVERRGFWGTKIVKRLVGIRDSLSFLSMHVSKSLCPAYTVIGSYEDGWVFQGLLSLGQSVISVNLSLILIRWVQKKGISQPAVSE